MKRVFKVNRAHWWERRDLPLLKYIFRIVCLCDDKERVNTAPWQHYPPDGNLWIHPLNDCGAFLIPSPPSARERQRSGCRPTFPTRGRLVRHCITVYFIYLPLHRGRMALFITVVRLIWWNASANGKNDWKGPFFSPRQITLRGERTLRLFACSVCFFLICIPSSSQQGLFKGQKKISRARSNGLLVVANGDFGIEAYSTVMPPSSQAAWVEASCR